MGQKDTGLVMEGGTDGNRTRVGQMDTGLGMDGRTDGHRLVMDDGTDGQRIMDERLDRWTQD